MEKILIGEVETHENSPERYCRYVHIVTKDAELTLELYANNPDALNLRTIGEDNRYVLDK